MSRKRLYRASDVCLVGCLMQLAVWSCWRRPGAAPERLAAAKSIVRVGWRNEEIGGLRTVYFGCPFMGAFRGTLGLWTAVDLGIWKTGAPIVGWFVSIDISRGELRAISTT